MTRETGHRNNFPIMTPGLTAPSSTPDVPITAKNGAPSSIVTAPEVNGSLQEWKPQTEDDYAVLAIRNLVCDLCMQNGGGHAGSALGMAAIGVALWKHTMRFNPCDLDWFDRDRFVLSNGKYFCIGMECGLSCSIDHRPGHASMFLYIMNYLVGYDAWTIDELKGYGHPKPNGYHTLAHGHPEIQVPSVEVTTGPLGQGIANAVGLAIASKNLAANFNRPGHAVVNSRIYCMTGDGCLMEGVALEGNAP
jgi:dihydroxyacetone synthase